MFISLGVLMFAFIGAILTFLLIRLTSGTILAVLCSLLFLAPCAGVLVFVVANAKALKF